MKPTGPTFDRNWRANSRVIKITKHDADAMIRQHYLKKWPGVCTLTLGLECFGKLSGVIVFALPPRETSKRYNAPTWELARLWIADHVPTNAETFFMSKAIRYIKRERSDVKMLVSYADPSVGHQGTIYKAANWVSDGRTDQERKTPRFDYACAVSGKRYSRRAHIPDGVNFVRVPRVSKFRFRYALA